MASKRLNMGFKTWSLTTLILVSGLAACHESGMTGQSVGLSAQAMNKPTRDTKPDGAKEMRHVTDSLITTRVKTAIFRDPKASGFQITVNTYRGVVQLSGFVDTIDQKQRAGELASSIEGVQEVRNDLIVTSRTSFTSSDTGNTGTTFKF